LDRLAIEANALTQEAELTVWRNGRAHLKEETNGATVDAPQPK
jgi:hypothetical protein